MHSGSAFSWFARRLMHLRRCGAWNAGSTLHWWVDGFCLDHIDLEGSDSVVVLHLLDQNREIGFAGAGVDQSFAGVAGAWDGIQHCV